MDNHRSIVVFLGPSLPLHEAREILDARYLPPAQFGDVYCLIGSGVHTIVLIDGVFHGRAPVWQRELWYAMQNGIRVYGASSMGALRAAELHSQGMIGLGRVFDAYITDEVDGDDEVALLHTGPEMGYRPLSEPLVNIRFNLHDAVARDILEYEQAGALIAAMKAIPFWQRTLDALWNTPAFCALEPPRRARLQQFYEKHAIDWKERDATRALVQVARSRDQPTPDSPSTSQPTSTKGASLGNSWFTNTYHDRFRLLKRRFSHDRDQEFDGEAVIDRVLSDVGRRKLLPWWCGARFFVRAWARESRIDIPATEHARVESVIRDRASIDSLSLWLRKNGLTEAEYQGLLADHVVLNWLLAQEPERFGLSSDLQDEALLPTLPAFVDLGGRHPICRRSDLAKTLPYVAAWCQMAGAAPDHEASQALTVRWGDALAALPDRPGADLDTALLQALWALSRGPIYFGFATWSFSTELLGQLQITGAIAKLTAAGDASTSAP